MRLKAFLFVGGPLRRLSSPAMSMTRVKILFDDDDDDDDEKKKRKNNDKSIFILNISKVIDR